MTEDHERFFRLDDEMTVVRTTLDHAAHVAGQMRYLERDRHVLEALLSLGVERLVKLTLGLTIEAETGKWPAQEIKTLSHGIAKIHTKCMNLVNSRQGFATNWGPVTAAAARLESDPLAAMLLDRLEMYAFGGRYYNLDYLAGSSRPEDPFIVWNRAEKLAVDTIPDPSTAEAGEMYLERRRAAIVETLGALRSFYFQAWVQGVCGPTAKQHAFSLQGGSPLEL